jgi:hypothetical protein
MDKEIDNCEKGILLEQKEVKPRPVCHYQLDKHITWHIPFVFLLIEIPMDLCLAMVRAFGFHFRLLQWNCLRMLFRLSVAIRIF